MDRLFPTILGLGIALCVGLTNINHANAETEIKFSGFLEITPYYANSEYRSTGQPHSTTKFTIGERFSFSPRFIVSEYVYALLELRVDNVWGTNYTNSPFEPYTMPTVYAKYAYLDFIPPGLESAHIRMGMQPVQFPGYVAGSAIMDTNVAGITAHYRFTDAIGVTGFWIRPYEEQYTRLATTDMFGLSVPINFNGISVIPWATYGISARNSAMQGSAYNTPAWWYPYTGEGKKNATMFWAGLTGQFTRIENLTLAMDFNYGNVQGIARTLDRKGWLLAGLASYKTSYGVPAIIGWYSSGDDKSLHNGSERLPTISPLWTASSYAWDGNYSSMSNGAGIMGDSPVGTWGIMLQMSDISFIDTLSHTVRVAYYRGTNNPGAVRRAMRENVVSIRTAYNEGGNGIYLTTKDSAIEVNVDSTYNVYKNLSVILELAYMRLNINEKLWGLSGMNKNGGRAALNFAYSF